MLHDKKPLSSAPAEFYMQLAMDQAHLAFQRDEVPIGAVAVDTVSGDILSKNFNRTIALTDPTAHAEILVLREACRLKAAQRIPDCDLYVTLEPCPMCASAISFARIRHVYFGAADIKSGGFTNGPCLVHHPSLHHKPGFTGGIMAEEASALLKEFFRQKR